MRRVLVTGSRNWPNPNDVFRALYVQLAFYSTFPNGDGPHMVVVHGNCPTGVDAFAQEWAQEFHKQGVLVERHTADWKRFGKKAGPLRNQEMVDAGAVVCLAFPLPDSRGTRDCMKRAETAGIPVQVVKPKQVAS